MLLLASLFAMEDKSLEEYYDSEMKAELANPPDAKGEITINYNVMFQSDHDLFLMVESKNKVQVELPLAPFLVKIVGVLRPRSLKITGKKTLPPENGKKNTHAFFVMCY